MSIGPGRKAHSRKARRAQRSRSSALRLGIIEDRRAVHVDFLPARAGAEPAVLDHLEEEGRAGVGRRDVEQRQVQRQPLGEVDRLCGCWPRSRRAAR